MGPFRYDGVSLNLNVEPISREISHWIRAGWYERQEATLVRKYLPSEVDVIELGAGIGYVSCIVNDVVDADKTHLAVEPHPEIIPVLEETRGLNDATFDICVAAYCISPGTTEFDLGEEYWNASTRRGSQSVEVQCVNLQWLCDRYSLSEFSLVMDIEGAEYELILSELELLEERCPFLLIEFHENGQYASSYHDELNDSSFELIDGIETVCAYQNTEFDAKNITNALSGRNCE